MTDDVCRICLVRPLKPKRAVNVQDIHEQWTFAFMFNSLTNLQIEEDEPQILCNGCSKDLVDSYAFQAKCFRAQEVLKRNRRSNRRMSGNNVTEEDIKVEVLLLEDRPNPSLTSVDLCSERRHEEINVSQSTKEDPIDQEMKEEEMSPDEPDFEPFDFNFEDERSKAESKSQKRKKKSNKKEKEKSVNPKKGRSMCPKCGKMINNAYIEEHIKTQHSGLPLEEIYYTCDLCNAKLKHKSYVYAHMHTHHLAKMRTCKVCGDTFRQSTQLLTHCRKVHTDLYPLLQCAYCDYKTPYVTKHNLHTKRHLGESVMKHSCCECGRKFLQLRALRDHMATHSDRRNFVCTLCGSTFKTDGGLKVHVRGVHAPQKGYECPVCQRTFATNQNMRLHVTKVHQEYQLPPPGTVLKKNSVKSSVWMAGTRLTRTEK